MLNQALINYGLAFLSARGYTPLQPPFFMKKEIMAETALRETHRERERKEREREREREGEGKGETDGASTLYTPQVSLSLHVSYTLDTCRARAQHAPQSYSRLRIR